jgi:hypothetical protein
MGGGVGSGVGSGVKNETEAEAEVGDDKEFSAGGDITESETNSREELDVSFGGDTERLVSETATGTDRPFLVPMKGSKLSGRFDFGP